jgi:predicted nucleotidyltransferase
MNRAKAVAMPTQIKPVLAARYGMTSLALFGSKARDAVRDNSDVSILVAFNGPATRNVTSVSSLTLKIS